MGSDAASTRLRTALGAIEDARTIEIASALAAIPAPLGEEGPLAEAVAGLLDRPGIDVHLQAVVPGRPNVIATVRGSGAGGGAGAGAQALILNAHLDAAWAPGGRRDPYRAEIEGGTALRGRDHGHEGAARGDDRGARGGGRAGRSRRRSRPPRGDRPQPDGPRDEVRGRDGASRAAGQASASSARAPASSCTPRTAAPSSSRSSSRGVPRTSPSRRRGSMRWPQHGVSPMPWRVPTSPSRACRPSDSPPSRSSSSAS